MVTRPLFPTLLWRAPVGDDPLRSDLETACWVLEDEDTAGNDWCDTEGYDGYTSYASLNDLPDRMPPFRSLADLLQTRADAFAADLGWDMSGRLLALDSLWVNILGEGGRHSGHIHPNSVISGTYYVAVPPDAGQIRFEDPRSARMMAAPPVRADADEHQKRFVYLTPVQGEALMWESWLRHEVMPGSTQAPRLSISFNFALENAPDTGAR